MNEMRHKIPVVKYMKVTDGMELGIEDLPCYDGKQLIVSIRSKAGSDYTLLVRCSSYIYDVSSKPEIYEKAIQYTY